MKLLMLLFFWGSLCFFCSCPGRMLPVTNAVIEFDDRKDALHASAGVFKMKTDTFRPTFHFAYQYKVDENTTYEFFTIGIKRLDDLIRGRFYLGVFESINLPVYAIGADAGAIMGYRGRYLNLYFALKASIEVELIENFAHIADLTPVIGLHLKGKHLAFFFEGSYNHLLYKDNRGTDIALQSGVYNLHFGINF